MALQFLICGVLQFCLSGLPPYFLYKFQSYHQPHFKFITAANLIAFIIKNIPILCNLFVHYSRSMLKLLDVLVQLDHLKNAKASIPNDFSWYKRYAPHPQTTYTCVHEGVYLWFWSFFSICQDIHTSQWSVARH